MEVTAWASEKDPANSRQDRIANVTMQRRHRSRFNAAFESISHDQSVAFAQPGDKCVQVAEIVTVVRVAHDDEAPMRGPNSAQQRSTIAFAVNRHDASP